MASAEDTEITLGTGKLLVLFFGLVGVCALFFALGYSLGRKSETPVTTASAAAPQTSSNTSKSSGSSTSTPAQPMGFYKAVEQKDPKAELTPPADTKTDASASTATNSTNTGATTSTTPANPNETTTLPSGAGYFVQVAAVSKQEDAEALVDALKKKDYPAFVAPAATDKLFRVQLGPFGDFKEADGMRAKLVGDGYSPIVKK